MPEASYYIFNVLVLAGPLALLVLRSKDISVRIWPLAVSLLTVSLPFIVWDIWAARGGHWGFNPKYTTGPDIFGIPLEEVLFFVTVPFAMVFVWEVVNKHFAEREVSKWWGYCTAALGLMVSAALLLIHWQKGYTRSVALALIPTILALAYLRLLRSRRFWIFSLIHLVCFLITNTLLTALPIITYGDGSYIGFRIGTIPIEDFIFSFCLIGLTISAYNFMYEKRKT